MNLPVLSLIFCFCTSFPLCIITSSLSESFIIVQGLIFNGYVPVAIHCALMFRLSNMNDVILLCLFYICWVSICRRVMVILDIKILELGTAIGFKIGNPKPITGGAEADTAGSRQPVPSRSLQPNRK